MIYQDNYADWSQDYDMFGEIENINEAEKNCLAAVFQENNVNTVLDCACGTGQHVIMLSKLGYEIYGSDFSEKMLKVCQNNLNKYDIHAIVKQCDYRYLQTAWNQKFDAVLCLTQALNHMLTKEDVISALTSMRDRLKKNGILIITQGTTHKTMQEEFRYVLAANNPDFSRVFCTGY